MRLHPSNRAYSPGRHNAAESGAWRVEYLTKAGESLVTLVTAKDPKEAEFRFRRDVGKRETFVKVLGPAGDFIDQVENVDREVTE